MNGSTNLPLDNSVRDPYLSGHRKRNLCGNELAIRQQSKSKHTRVQSESLTVNSTETKTGFTCPHGSKKIRQSPELLVALTLVAPRDLLRDRYDSVSGEFDEELMVL